MAFLRYIVAPCAVIALVITAGCASAPREKPAAQEKPVPVEKAPQDDAAKVAAVLRRLQDDVTHRRSQRVFAAISDAYKDDAGRDFAAVKDYIGAQFRDYRTVQVTRTTPKITVQGAEARSVESLGVVGEPTSAKVPPFSFQGNVSVTLRRVEDTWQITKVQLLR